MSLKMVHFVYFRYDEDGFFKGNEDLSDVGDVFFDEVEK